MKPRARHRCGTDLRPPCALAAALWVAAAASAPALARPSAAPAHPPAAAAPAHPPAAAAPAHPPAAAAPAHPPAAAHPRRLNIDGIQGMLAVRRLGGWLLYDFQGENPIAAELVAPSRTPTQRWFYFIPAQGKPTALVQAAETSAFAGVPGKVESYSGYRDLTAKLKALLRGTHRVAMEYAPKSGIPALTRVDPGTVALVRRLGAKVESSAELVQFATSMWHPDGRVAHYVAAYHLHRLYTDALAFVAARLRAGKPVSERDVQQHILRGYKVRGLTGPPPVVAAGADSADPTYVPGPGRSAQIKRGQILFIKLAARVDASPRPIYAELAWTAYVGDRVPARYQKLFATVARARDAAIKLISDRRARRQPVRGFEVDRKARAVITAAGYGDRFLHRLGHSIDTDLRGNGANLDDYDTHDTRALTIGSGYTVGPAIYLAGDAGVAAEVDIYIGGQDVEVTSPPERRIPALLAPSQRIKPESKEGP